ncbi:UDP-N-acetylmuramate dehydrogenase [Xylanibacillus composti]|uniref:UDP-N-acetylenolpyruvoylglucosamine reductase n=1 Tax=Xylanibacillus composti TaxID=1572762 RepID=A0A8J4M1Y2_9BACL|nr:UDP-N-acetylmuramate dehydrogenase [Xylanibacillus composti]MDT9724365.1 UDP-N-acetylmuramate dehydrogenase [Xylanibacillus composti]GIQ67956.1 UDP-N-acetylenolpyruvoylglucosamine reductase 1 [Xylanibacillus composti]
MNACITELKEAHIGRVLANEPMADYTTWKIGGPADVLIVPDGKAELMEAMRILYRHKMPWMLLGRGSNLLVSDKGIRGAVIKLGPAFEQLRYEGDLVYVGGAYSFIKLSVMTGKQGLTGLEYAGGIPGTVGGAVYMNAGAHGSDVSRILQSAEVVTEKGELVRMDNEDFQFAYRYSRLHDHPGIVTEAVFKLAPGDRKEIAAAMASFKDRRLRTQPLQMACAGSVFRNPEQHFAAKLIEEAGLKGTRVGGAEVSVQHANFIVNTGNATAEDVITLIRNIQHIVKEKAQVELIPEVLFVGER